MKLKPYQEDEYCTLADATMVERAREDLLSFTLYTKEDYRVNWHHEKLAERLDAWVRGDIRYLMVFMPPRHGKSELVSRRLPAYIHGRNPDAEIMAVSYLGDLATDMTLAVQGIIDSPEYKRVFPDTTIYPPGNARTVGVRNTEEHRIKGRRGKYRGQGVGGSFTGKGANFIIIDDPIKGREIADSITYRDRLWNFYLSDLYSRLETDLESGRMGQILITQTRWHEDDLSGRLIESMKKDPKAIQWEILSYPALRVDKDDKTDPREIGGALWEKKYNVEQLTEIKSALTVDSGPRAWSSLYQQNPVPDGGGLFKDKMFAYASIPDHDEFDYTFAMADTAYTEKEESDFTVFTVFGVKDDLLNIIDVFREQVASTEVEAKVEAFMKRHLKYGYRGTYIEPKGHGIYLNQRWRIKGNMMIPDDDTVKEFYKDRRWDKVERANNAAPHLSYRKIYINMNIPNKEELVSECLNFPKGKHDDFVDTVVDGVKFVYAKEIGILDVLGG